MEDIFLRIFALSLKASCLIAAVALVRVLLRRSPKWIRCALWGLCALRLLLPFSVESDLSLIPEQTQSYANERYAGIQSEYGHISSDVAGNAAPAVISGASAAEAEAQLTSSDGERAWSLTKTASVVWLSGMCGMLIYALVSYLMLKRRVNTAVAYKKNIYACENVRSPFVLGLLKPRIYLPTKLDGYERSSVIAHERAHISRRDHIIKPLGFMLLAVYWFNPLVWLAYVLLCRDIELACDEKVIRGLGEDERRAYSNALIECSVRHRSIAACPVAFGEVGVKQRIKGILSYKKPAFWIIIVALAVCVVLAVCFLTDPISGEKGKQDGQGTSAEADEQASAPSNDVDMLAWMRSLSAEDIASAAFSNMAVDADKQYHEYSEDEYEALAELLRGAEGELVMSPENLAGVCAGITVTLTDGTRYTLKNMDNTFLVVNNTYYKAPSEWLSSWPVFGDSRVPAAQLKGADHMVFAGLIYVNPLSSQYYGNGTGCDYYAYDDGFAIADTLTGDTIEAFDTDWVFGSSDDIDWSSWFEGYSSIAPDFSSYGKPVYIELSDEYRLLLVDEELWLMQTHGEHVWYIIRLGSAESTERTQTPMTFEYLVSVAEKIKNGTLVWGDVSLCVNTDVGSAIMYTDRSGELVHVPESETDDVHAYDFYAEGIWRLTVVDVSAHKDEDAVKYGASIEYLPTGELFDPDGDGDLADFYAAVLSRDGAAVCSGSDIALCVLSGVEPCEITFDEAHIEKYGVPFTLYAGGYQYNGGKYRLYDAETGAELDFVHPSGLRPQTYILKDAVPGRRYIITVSVYDEQTRKAFEYAFCVLMK